MSSLESVAKYFFFRVLGVAARSEEPFATHIPVLVGVAAACLPRRLVEFGSGNFSTLAFLDEAVFPSLLRVESYENNLFWMQQMEVKLAGSPRVACHFFEGRMRDAVSGANLAVADLIFLDDSANGSERGHTLREVARTCGERPITIVHDYELLGIRLACRRFEHRFAFTPSRRNVVRSGMATRNEWRYWRASLTGSKRMLPASVSLTRGGGPRYSASTRKSWAE